jgi:hypothetical protein
MCFFYVDEWVRHVNLAAWTLGLWLEHLTCYAEIFLYQIFQYFMDVFLGIVVNLGCCRAR